MKLQAWATIGLFLSSLAAGCARSEVSGSSAAETSLRAFLPRFEEGTSRFINGDPTLWNDNASRREDATIMGAWGGYEKGWSEVGPRYDWVAGRLRESGAKVRVEYLSSGVDGNLAYTVAIERSELRHVNQDRPTPSALRVTHIFRQEDGAWKLVHRHADPLMDTSVPSAVPQK
jgi:ketosteroid isomerase-like protein